MILKRILIVFKCLLLFLILNLISHYLIIYNYEQLIILDKVFKTINLEKSNYSLNNLDLINFLEKDINLIFSPVDLIREKNKYSSLINNNLISYSNISKSKLSEKCGENYITYYEVDDYGFRNKLISPQIANVVVLGDSYAFGSCHEQSITDLLNKNNNNSLKYYNLSAHGNDLLILKNSLIHFLKFFGKKKFIFLISEGVLYYTNLHNENSVFVKDDFSNSFFSKKIKNEIDKLVSNDLNEKLEKRKKHFKNYHELNIKKIFNLFYIREIISYFEFNNVEKNKNLENVKRNSNINMNYNDTLENNIKVLDDLIMIAGENISII